MPCVCARECFWGRKKRIDTPPTSPTRDAAALLLPSSTGRACATGALSWRQTLQPRSLPHERAGHTGLSLGVTERKRLAPTLPQPEMPPEPAGAELSRPPALHSSCICAWQPPAPKKAPKPPSFAANLPHHTEPACAKGSCAPRPGRKEHAHPARSN